MKRYKSMKISQYLQIVKPKYIYLKLTPDTSIRNYNSTNIAQSISKMYKGIFQQIRKREHWYTPHFVADAAVKCSYFIDIYKDDVNFYFIIPKQHVSMVREKIQKTWGKISIEEVGEIEGFSTDALKYQLQYKKEDAFSLTVDKTSNEPLNSIFGVIDIMKDNDRIGVFYNFIPCHQLPFRKEYKDTMAKVKEGKPVDKDKLNGEYIFKTAAGVVIYLLDAVKEVANDFTGGIALIKDNNVNFLEIASDLFNNPKKLSTATNKKENAIIINTQMLVLSESNDKIRLNNNAISVCQSYRNISDINVGGNELVYKKISNKNILKKPINVFHMNDLVIAGAELNRVSVDECQNFIQLPGRELLDQYNISKIDTLESTVPVELQTGVMCLGNVTYKGMAARAFLSNDKEFKNLTLCIIGPTRAGKTTLISNLTRDAINNGECTILFDFCGNCDLSDDVSKVIKNVLNIDCSNADTLQGLGYNEITTNENTIFEIYRCAKAKTSQLMTLVNALSDDEELKARMERYMEAAAIVTFIQGGSIKDVFKVLQDHILRKQYIDNAPVDQAENLEEYILSLEELNEWSKASKDCSPEVIGTKTSYIQGIINRVSKLKQNTYMELMLKKDCTNNINLVEEIQKSQLICIRMPEVMFSTEQEKDIYCTYWITKIWGALQVRKWNIPDAKNRTKVNIVFDELYQVPSCQSFLKTKLSQIAKFSAKPIISCHYLGQISNIRNELKAANSSYMLIQGCDKDNFKELKEELDPYILEDLLKLKRYESLNLIKYEKGWSKFISKLPKPIKDIV